MDKQSLVPAVQELWNAWEIHFMILLSLSLQVFLFLFTGLWRRSSNWFLQTVLWLAYLSADFVAVFVLGHLAVRTREPGHELMAFWAPFVLVHLGGQDSITAFAKQDNDLWRRHLLNLVIQAGIAGYVVAKASWPDTRLRDATVIMFVCGCLKYAERVYCLFFGARENLRKRTSWFKLVGDDAYRTKDMRDTLDAMMSRGSSSWPSTELFPDARTIILEVISVDAPLNKEDNITVAAAQDDDILAAKLKRLGSSLESGHNAYEYVGAVLEYCYRLLYSKDLLRFGPHIPWNGALAALLHPTLQTCLRILISSIFNLVSTVATSIALVLFMSTVHKQRDQLHTSSNRVDITVTYALLVGAIVLDVSSAASLIIFLYYRSLVTCGCSQELGQYNIIIGPTTVYTLPSLVCDALNCYNKPITKDHMSIKKFILDTLVSSGARKEWSIASTRGQLALHNWMAHHDLTTTTTTLKSLEKIIRSNADFPTSVLILHIATDICYHYRDGGTNNSSDHDEAVKKHKQTSTELSYYIMYLVFRCGVMLTTNSQILHDTSRREILKTLLPGYYTEGSNIGRPAWIKRVLFNLGNHKDDTLKLIDEINKQKESSEQQQVEINDDDNNAAADDHMIHIKKLQLNSDTLKSPVLPRAVAVAEELNGIVNETDRWELIAKVWAEMLYYIAPRCGSDFHYEHLSTGGEFVTHVLLLMYYLGPFLPPPS